MTSSASAQSPRISYVLRHSVMSASHLALSASVALNSFPASLPSMRLVSVVEKKWSRSEDNVDLIRSILYHR